MNNVAWHLDSHGDLVFAVHWRSGRWGAVLSCIGRYAKCCIRVRTVHVDRYRPRCRRGDPASGWHRTHDSLTVVVRSELLLSLQQHPGRRSRKGQGDIGEISSGVAGGNSESPVDHPMFDRLPLAFTHVPIGQLSPDKLMG